MVEFLDVIRKYDDYTALGSIEEECIKNAESTLGLKFADDYRSFIKACGAACANGHEFLGICDSNRLNIVYETLKAKEHNPHIARDMYLIENVGIDKIRTWQDSRGKLFQTVDNEEPVILKYDLLEYLES